MSETIVTKCPCGWCLTGFHEDCKAELEWNSKRYLCGCKSCDVPSRLGVESKHEEHEPSELSD